LAMAASGRPNAAKDALHAMPESALGATQMLARELALARVYSQLAQRDIARRHWQQALAISGAHTPELLGPAEHVWISRQLSTSA
jgi:hypothetical protein